MRRWVPTAVMVVAFLAVSKGPLYTVRVELGTVTGDFIDDRGVQAAFAVLYLVMLLVFRHGVDRLRTLPDVTVATTLFSGVLVLSAWWSIDTRRTLEQAALLGLGTTAFLVAGAAVRPARLLVSFWIAMQVGTLASLAAGIVDRDGAFDRNGDLAGIYFNRNSLGLVVAAATLSSLALWCVVHEATPGRRGARAVLAVALGLDVAVWVWSGSFTPVLAVSAALLAAAVAAVTTRAGVRPAVRRAVVGLATAVVVLGVVGVAARSALTRLIDRSPTFSGRTEIWSELWTSITVHPVRGWGFMAVWSDPSLRARLVERGRDVYEAHSGYLEVLAGAGAIGALTLAGVVVVTIRRVVLRTRLRGDAVALWLVAATAFVLVANLGETYVAANVLPWSLLVATAAQTSWAPLPPPTTTSRTTSATLLR